MSRLGLVLLVVVVAACSQPASHSNPPSPSTGAHLSGVLGAAAYEIEVPPGWNGTLFLYSHGYVAPGGANAAQAAPAGDVRTWLLGRRFAIAGSAYSSTGWALEDAFKDQVALLDHFTRAVGKPKRVVAWGHSLGGIVTAGLVQLYPERFAGALPMCGVLAGGQATWNSELDAAWTFKTLLAPSSSLQLVHVTDGAANLRLAQSIFNTAAQTPQGRARLALVSALIDLPGWFDPTKPEPAKNDYAAQSAAQLVWESRVDFPFAFQYRAELESRAGGNPSWNAGVVYSQLFALSEDRDEVTSLYGQAGLDLGADLSALDAAPKIAPDAAASRYLARNVSFDGELSIPVLSVHTTGDGLVVPENESAYAQVVGNAGGSGLLRQLYVHRAGHCAFTPAETVVAIEALLKRLDSGRWDDTALQPDQLNGSAAGLGTANSIFGFSFSPAFVAYRPAPYLRPYFSGDAIPA